MDNTLITNPLLTEDHLNAIAGWKLRKRTTTNKDVAFTLVIPRDGNQCEVTIQAKDLLKINSAELRVFETHHFLLPQILHSVWREVVEHLACDMEHKGALTTTPRVDVLPSLVSICLSADRMPGDVFCVGDPVEDVWFSVGVMHSKIVESGVHVGIRQFANALKSIGVDTRANTPRFSRHIHARMARVPRCKLEELCKMANVHFVMRNATTAS